MKINGKLDSNGPVESEAKTGLSSSSGGYGAEDEVVVYLSALSFSKCLHLMDWVTLKYLAKIKTDPS